MSSADLKLELVQKLLNTDDKNIINYIKTIFSTQPEDWFDNLPDEVKASVKRGLKQSETGQTEPHEKVMKRFRK